MNLQGTLMSIFLINFFQLMIVKGATYQDIQSTCNHGKAACVILTFTQGYNQAYQSGSHRIDCASSGNSGQICSYSNGGVVNINCNHSDGISVSISGNKAHPNFKGNAEQTFSSDGANTDTFSASCLTKG